LFFGATILVWPTASVVSDTLNVSTAAIRARRRERKKAVMLTR
jgi:hypothetical protein